MTCVELVAAVLGRDISGAVPQTPLGDLGITSKELVILLANMEQNLGYVIDFEVLSGLSTVESFDHFLESASRPTPR